MVVELLKLVRGIDIMLCGLILSALAVMIVMVTKERS